MLSKYFGRLYRSFVIIFTILLMELPFVFAGGTEVDVIPGSNPFCLQVEPLHGHKDRSLRSECIQNFGKVWQNSCGAAQSILEKAREIGHSLPHRAKTAKDYYMHNKENILVAACFATFAAVPFVCFLITHYLDSHMGGENHQFNIIARHPLDINIRDHPHSFHRHMITLGETAESDLSLTTFENTMQYVFPLIMGSVANWFSNFNQSGTSTIMKGTQGLAQNLVAVDTMKNLANISLLLLSNQCPSDQTTEWAQLTSSLSQYPWPRSGSMHYCALKNNASIPQIPFRLLGCGVANLTNSAQNNLIQNDECHSSLLNWGNSTADVIIFKTSQGGISITLRPVHKEPQQSHEYSLSHSLSNDDTVTVSLSDDESTTISNPPSISAELSISDSSPKSPTLPLSETLSLKIDSRKACSNNNKRYFVWGDNEVYAVEVNKTSGLAIGTVQTLLPSGTCSPGMQLFSFHYPWCFFSYDPYHQKLYISTGNQIGPRVSDIQFTDEGIRSGPWKQLNITDRSVDYGRFFVADAGILCWQESGLNCINVDRQNSTADAGQVARHVQFQPACLPLVDPCINQNSHCLGDSSLTLVNFNFRNFSQLPNSERRFTMPYSIHGNAAIIGKQIYVSNSWDGATYTSFFDPDLGNPSNTKVFTIPGWQGLAPHDSGFTIVD